MKKRFQNTEERGGRAGGQAESLGNCSLSGQRKMNPGGERGAEGRGKDGWAEAGPAPVGWVDSPCSPSCTDCSMNISEADQRPEEQQEASF